MVSIDAKGNAHREIGVVKKTQRNIGRGSYIGNIIGRTRTRACKKQE
jgi:hypothetical protein